MSSRKSALFICLGNICRSPIAEGVFLDMITRENIRDQWIVDSAAIGAWHVGRNPDARALCTMKKHNVPYDNKARQITKEDFNKFDYVFGMDLENISDLEDIAPKNCRAKILLLGDFDPENDRIIRDPYYDRGPEGFEKCFQQCVRSCDGFLKKTKTNQI